jgi:hypothetical protein
MKIPKPNWSRAWKWILLPPISFVVLVLLIAAALGTGVEGVFFMTLGQVGHMAVHYPLWAWLLFAALLLVATRLWGLIGALLMYYPISATAQRLDVHAIAPTGADTADIIFALGCLHRMTILVVVFFWLIVLPTIRWRQSKLNLSFAQACFYFRIKSPRFRGPHQGVTIGSTAG